MGPQTDDNIGEKGGAGWSQEGTRRGNGSTPVLSPGTAQPWAVITNHTFHFWGDIFLLLDQWRGIRGDLKSQKESESWVFLCFLGKKQNKKTKELTTANGTGANITQSGVGSCIWSYFVV